MAGTLTGDHPLAGIGDTGREGEASLWPGVPGVELGPGVAALLSMGLAVRVSVVGYGRALRVGVTDGRGWTGGWTLGSPEELHGLCEGVQLPGAQAFVESRLERPQRRK